MSILLTASESASAGSMIPLILMYVVVFGVFFYFVLYRPRLLRNHHRHHR